MKNFVFFPSISLSHIGSAAFETRLDRGHLPTIQFFPTWGHDRIFSNQNSKRIMKRVQRAAHKRTFAQWFGLGLKKLAFFVAQLGCQIEMNGNRFMHVPLACSFGKILR